MIRGWLNISDALEGRQSILQHFCGKLKGNNRTSKLRFAALDATIYHVWNLRNRAYFENTIIDATVVFRRIQLTVFAMCLDTDV
ncbi:hypothetical protein F511_12388 [Dorcoceras hygrometricum]|uniref:Uncharacterized protein n=1 Tax=Dorcoceras hygrometricum TaxID=472368 RepID=A0A2Z7A627_9LAMI|nr:hypothetical protein F511_12388 [Dorcoceras hygrometricum]